MVAARRNTLWPALLLALMLGATVLAMGRPALAAPQLRLPDPPVSASYGPWLQGTLGSVRDLTLAGVPPGHSITDGFYAAWCLEGERFGSPSLAKLYSSYGPNLPPDVAGLPWPQINYLINHKQGGAQDVQAALWMLIGAPTAEFPVTPAALAMVADAARNPGFVPGPGQVVAVIAYSDGMQGNLQGFQELIFEVWLPWAPDTATPTATPTVETATPTLTPTSTPTGGTLTPTSTPTGGTTTPTPTNVSLLPYPAPLNTGFSFYFFGWRPPDWGWLGWLWLLCCLPLLLLPLLPLLLLGRRSTDRLVERFVTTTTREEQQTSASSERAAATAVLQAHRESASRLLSEVERLQSDLRERAALAERISEVERDTRSRQSELRTALLTARHQRETAEELRERVERLLDRRGWARERRVEIEQWRREVERLLVLLRRWHSRLYDSDSDLAVLYMLLIARHERLSEDNLGRIRAAFEAIELRLRVLLRRLESGDISVGTGGYELVIQLIEHIRLRLDRLRLEIGRSNTLIEDRLLLERILAALLASRGMSQGLWSELLRLRRELTAMRLRLVAIEERRSAFSIEDVEIVPVGLHRRSEEVRREVSAARRTQIAHLAPLISWTLVCVEGERRLWRAVITVRNEYLDVVFTGVRVELIVTMRAPGQLAAVMIGSPSGLMLEFGELRYSEAWQTRELELAGLVAERSEFVVCVVGTWVIAPAAARAPIPEIIEAECE